MTGMVRTTIPADREGIRVALGAGNIVFCAGVLGATLRSACERPTATGSPRAPGAASWDSGVPVRRPGDSVVLISEFQDSEMGIQGAKSLSRPISRWTRLRLIGWPPALRVCVITRLPKNGCARCSSSQGSCESGVMVPVCACARPPGRRRGLVRLRCRLFLRRARLFGWRLRFGRWPLPRRRCPVRR